MGRDALDKRFCLSGNLDQLDMVINGMADKGQDRYLHITLSFAEKTMDTDTLKEISDCFESELMAAYDKREYCFYSECHLPKIQRVEDKKTGEMVERLPHIHIVIPKTNLATGKSLNPIGLHQSKVPYLDAIQEKINHQFGLISAYDSPRLSPISKSDILSRIKGDEYRSKNGTFKTELIDKIASRQISSRSEFIKELQHHGEVTERNAGKESAYFAVKLAGDSKFTNLKGQSFSMGFIERGELKRVRPSEADCEDRLSQWREVRAKEIKYIVKASEKVRAEYKTLSVTEQKQALLAKEQAHNDKHGLTIKPKTHKAESIGLKAQFASTQVRTFEQIPVGLPPSMGNFSTTMKDSEVSTEIVKPTEFNSPHVPAKTNQDQTSLVLGSILDGTQGSYLHSLAVESHEKGLFRQIKQELQPKYLLALLEKPFNLDLSQHTYFKTDKDGSYRIKSDKQNLNVSDFLTKRLNLSFDEAKPYLTQAMQNQQSAIDDKQDKKAVKDAVFESRLVEKAKTTPTTDYDFQSGLRAAKKVIERELKEQPSSPSLDEQISRIYWDECNKEAGLDFAKSYQVSLLQRKNTPIPKADYQRIHDDLMPPTPPIQAPEPEVIPEIISKVISEPEVIQEVIEVPIAEPVEEKAVIDPDMPPKTLQEQVKEIRDEFWALYEPLHVLDG